MASCSGTVSIVGSTATLTLAFSGAPADLGAAVDLDESSPSRPHPASITSAHSSAAILGTRERRVMSFLLMGRPLPPRSVFANLVSVDHGVCPQDPLGIRQIT